MEPEGLEEFQDVVRFQDRDGKFVSVVGKVLEEVWWEKQRVEVVKRRLATLGRVYPAETEIWWKVSTKMFVRPSLRGEVWINKAPPGLVKWVARARTGALATMERMTRTGYVKGPDGTPGDPKCECCGAAVEDDEHMLTGCPETGTDKVVAHVLSVWQRVMTKAVGKGASEVVGVVDPPEAWFEKYKMQWAVGLIPVEARTMLGVQDSLAVRLMSEVSMLMCEWLQERMRDRERLLSEAATRRGGDRKAEISALSKKKKVAHAPQVGIGRFGLTDGEVRELARGEVEIRWSDERTKMSKKDQEEKKRRMDMKGWILRYFSPQQIVDPKDDGEAASVHSLLILWEVENGPFPCPSGRFTQVLGSFTKELSKTLRGMDSPYREVKSERVRRLIAAGAGGIWLHKRFGLKLENPPPEFLEKWKDFIRWVAKGHMQGTHGAGGVVRAQQWAGYQRGGRRGRGRGGRRRGRGRGRTTAVVILDDDGDDEEAHADDDDAGEGEEESEESDESEREAESGVSSSEEDLGGEETSEESEGSESADDRGAERGEVMVTGSARMPMRAARGARRGARGGRGGGRSLAVGAERAGEGKKRMRETEGGCSPPKRGRTGAGAGALKQGRGTKRKRDVDPAGGGEDREMPSDGGSGGLGDLHGGVIHGTAGSTAGHGRATTGTAIPNDGADGS